MPQFVWVTEPSGLNTYFNQRWVEYTGLSLDDSLGSGWIKPFHPDDTQSALTAWSHAIETEGHYEIESRLRRADGKYRWFILRGLPMRDSSGRIMKWIGTCTDIDDQKRFCDLNCK